MLERVETKTSGRFMNFNAITRYSNGTGLCYVYNTVMRATKAGKPFITLYLRDVKGNSIPGYVFDLKSPLVAGGEAAKVMDKIVQVDWQENYLRGIGLTLILDSVSIVESATADDYAMFRGVIEGLGGKLEELKQYFYKQLNMTVALPVVIETVSSADYSSGMQGGLLEHYWKMASMLSGLHGLTDKERYKLSCSFLLYILVHSNYIRAQEQGMDNIELVTSLTEKVSNLSRKLEVGAGALELVHMFFGYEPKDIYVRTVANISDTVQRIEKEFALYHTIPLEQEGNAGYGKIRRYQLEEENA